MSFCKVKRTVSITCTVCNNLSISKQKSLIYMHSGRKKIINLWLCIQEGKKYLRGFQDWSQSMHPGKKNEQSASIFQTWNSKQIPSLIFNWTVNICSVTLIYSVDQGCTFHSIFLSKDTSREKGLEWSRTYFLESVEWSRTYFLDHLLLPVSMIQLTTFFKAKPSGFSDFM